MLTYANHCYHHTSTFAHKCKKERLKAQDSIQCRSEDVLCLSLDWPDRRQNRLVIVLSISNNILINYSERIIVSSSDGYLSMITSIDGTFVTDMSWLAHDYEAWTSAWDTWDANVVYSGTMQGLIVLVLDFSPLTVVNLL